MAGQPATRLGRCHDIGTTVSTKPSWQGDQQHAYNSATTPSTMHPRHFHTPIVSRRFPRTVVARRPAARPRLCHDAIHDASTTLPRHDSATTVSTNRRFIVKNRPRNRHGKATSSTPTTPSTMHPQHFHATIVPRRFPRTVVLLSKTIHKTVVARRPAARPRCHPRCIHDTSTPR